MFDKSRILFLTAVTLVVFLAGDAHAQRNPVAGEVTRSGDTWTAEVNGSSVYVGPDMIAAIQGAVDNLRSGRTRKETVHIRDSGVMNQQQSSQDAVHLPSYTILDFHDNTVEAQGNSIIPVRAQDVEQIEVRNLRVIGNPRFGIFMKGCRDVIMENIHLSLGPTDFSSQLGGGIRTEGGGQAWSGTVNENFVMNDIYVEDTSGHGVELWRTDGLTVGTITTRNTNYAGLLLNQTRNAHIELVDAYRANFGGGYAGFRTANDAGPNIVVDKVIAVECGRGVFTVSGSHGITIHEVDISGSSSHGMLIEDTQDFTVNGGTISGTGAEGVRITSRSLGQGPGGDHLPSQNNTIRNLHVFRCPWGIRETLPRTNNNRIFNNNVWQNDNCLFYEGEGTVAVANQCFRGGVTEDRYLAWLHRLLMDGSEEQAAPDYDPGESGLPNLLRYALDIEDENPPHSELPRTLVDGDHLALEFRRSTIKDDIAYVVEASSDLANWDEVLYDSRLDTGPNTHGTHMRVPDRISLNEADAPRFLRLRIAVID